MATLNDRSVQDGNTYVLAVYYNKLLGNIFRKDFSNAVVMTTDLVLTDGDMPIQRLDCNGANRVVSVPPGADGNHPFLLINVTSSGSWTLTVKSNDGVNTLKVLNPGDHGFFTSDGNGTYMDLIAFESDHGALTGLSDDDHTQYLLATGLREWSEQASAPSTPASGKWLTYFKTDGLYIKDDAGNEIGPLGSELAQWSNFTPQVYQNGNVTSAIIYSRYIKVGNLVTVQVTVQVTGAGSSGQKILIQNLPFSIANHSTTGVYIIGNGAVLDSGTAIYAVAVCAHDATTISFFDSGAGDFLGISPAWALANNDTISFAITYKVP
jgi:hypothetical protein